MLEIYDLSTSAQRKFDNTRRAGSWAKFSDTRYVRFDKGIPPKIIVDVTNFIAPNEWRWVVRDVDSDNRLYRDGTEQTHELAMKAAERAIKELESNQEQRYVEQYYEGPSQLGFTSEQRAYTTERVYPIRRPFGRYVEHKRHIEVND